MEAYSSGHGIELQRLRKMSAASEGSHRAAIEEESKGDAPPAADNVAVNFKALDQYVFALTQNMVDDVCLFNARVQHVERTYHEKENNCIEKEELDQVHLEKMDALSRIPLAAVSKNSEKSDNPNRV